MKKNTLVIVSICIASIFAVSLVWMVCQAGIDYGIMLIQNEQEDHYVTMHEKVMRVDGMMAEMDALQTLIGTNKNISDYEKRALTERLRTLEEVAAEISRETVYYDEDNSVHMFFPPEGRIVGYFDEARNTPLYMQRYMRSMEQVIADGRMTQNHKEIIEENFLLLRKELDDLARIAQY